MTTASQTVSSTTPQQTTGRSLSTIKLVGNFFKYGALLLLSFTWLFPLYWMIATALKDDPQVYTVPPIWIPDPAHWNNFIDGWNRLPFNLAAFNSIVRYSVPVTLFTVVSSMIVAYGFAKIRWRGRGFFFGLCIATMMLPWQVTMVPLFIIFKNLGWINSPLYLPLVLPNLFGVPYFIFLLRQFLMSIPEELSEASRIEGASEWTILWRIIMPLSKPAIAVVVLFRFLWSWNDYLGPLIYLQTEELYPLALMVYRLQRTATSMGNTALAYPHLMAVSTIITLPVIIAFILAQRQFIEGISLTGMKG
ncbi:MAG: carbohydrate ABC transporter permease [Caldilineaceae bacterium]|nr:carbohydrate ABC transporter permease [Caldilineaceae bacterium]MCB9162063.1 carbohydrate ABC transporter permease [Caldilineaceae bacterium]